MENLGNLTPEIIDRLQLWSIASQQVVVGQPNHPPALPELDFSVLELAPREGSSDEDLCNVCQRLNIDTIRGESDDPVEFLLGYVKDILKTTRCALCRLVSKSIQLNWTTPPLYCKDGRPIRCHLFIPGPQCGEGRREMVIIPAIPYDVSQEGADSIDRRGTLRLLEDDLTLVKPARAGEHNLVAKQTRSQFNLEFLREKYIDCQKKHGIRCDWFKFLSPPDTAEASGLPLKAMSFAQNLRVIDVMKQNIVKAPFNCQFVVLSYVWGKVEFLQLKKANRVDLEKEGAFLQHKPPPTVQDAIELTRSLGERYLWVDALCIVQDDDNDKHVQIRQMDVIYSIASLTIVAAAGEDANTGLPGLSSHIRRPAQAIESIRGLRFAAMHPRLSCLMDTLPVNTRGWTFQELALSKRVICLTPRQNYYFCRSGICSEDSGAEGSLTHEQSPSNSLSVFNLSLEHGVWQCYKQIVNQYTCRKFTFERDIIDALDGLFSSLQTVEDEAFICALPETLLDTALLWQPNGPLRRRKPLLDGHLIPSWSWAGWVGNTGYGWLLDPDQIHTEITSWSIEIAKDDYGRDADVYRLYVDSNYLSEDTEDSLERARFRGLRNGRIPPASFEETLPRWEQSPWRTQSPTLSRVAKAGRAVRKATGTVDTRSTLTNDNHHILSYKHSAQEIPRIQRGTLRFTTQMASFIIASWHGEVYKNTMRPNPRARETLQILYRERTGPSIWVGSLLLEAGEAEDMDTLTVGDFIILSSTNISFNLFGSELGVQMPHKGKIYDETRFGALSSSSVQPMLYNVMWIQWHPRGSTRRGIGQIHRRGWALSNYIERRIMLD